MKPNCICGESREAHEPDGICPHHRTSDTRAHHGACTCPVCAPALWKAGVKGSSGTFTGFIKYTKSGAPQRYLVERRRLKWHNQSTHRGNQESAGVKAHQPVTDVALRVIPMSLRQARAFVQEHHRHHDMPQGGLWALALMRGPDLVGVAIAGRPVSRMLQAKNYCEIVRCCVLDGVPNGCSMLYGRCRRVAQAMGYAKVVTYTLPSEGGASLRAASYEPVAETDGGSWSRPSRGRIDTHPLEPKTRWEAAA